MFELQRSDSEKDHVSSRPVLSVVTPAYNEADNLPLLHSRLSQVLEPLNLAWEWIVVDDHSHDRTFAVIAEIAETDQRVRGIRLARNFGSHTAMTCGLHHARGDCAVIMAADLQDPPETLSALLAEWQAGAQVVWAVRARRAGDSTSTVAFAQLYYWLMRRFVGLNEMPATGADFFLIDRCVIEALRQYNALAGTPAAGWSSLMIVMLIIGGMQMLMMGILGEYLWRALDESRRRPRYLIEAATSMTEVMITATSRQYTTPGNPP